MTPATYNTMDVGVGVPGGKYHAVFHDVSRDGRHTRHVAQCNRAMGLSGQIEERDPMTMDPNQLCGRCFR